MNVTRLEIGIKYKLPQYTKDGCHEIGVETAWFSRRIWDIFEERYRYIFRADDPWHFSTNEIFLSREDIAGVELDMVE